MLVDPASGADEQDDHANVSKRSRQSRGRQREIDIVGHDTEIVLVLAYAAMSADNFHVGI